MYVVAKSYADPGMQRKLEWVARMLDASKASAAKIGCSPEAIVAHAAQAQPKEQLPTGKQYLVGQLAAAEAKLSDMLDEIASLRKQIDVMREMMTKREEKKP